ncbi:MAG: response regulator [Myxococcota bacterium]|nr:response regulator [Myxococcota bacterium]
MEPLDASGLAAALRSLSRIQDVTSMEEAVCQRLIELSLAITGFETAVALSSGHEQRPTAVANHGVDEEYVRFILDNYVNMPGMRALESGETLVVPDAASNPRYAPIVKKLARAGIAAIVVYPMRAFGQELMGALVTYHSCPQLPGSDVVGQVQALVDHGSLVIANSRLLSARRYLLQQTILEKNQEVVAVVAAGIAHDFNNMLGSLLSLVTLTPALNAKELQTACKSLEMQVEQAALLSRNLLNLARPGPVEDAAAPADLTVAARDAVAMVRPALHGNTRLLVHLPDQKMEARIAPAAFSRVVLNLLLNALHAVEGQRDGTISLRFRADGPDCVLEVDDNGPGVPEEHADRIFEPFVSFTKGEGSGVGLAAARGIVERAGGALLLQHREGPGACFAVRLPVAGGDAVPAPQLTDTGEEIDGVGGGRRLLLAEDQDVQRQAYARALEDAGYRVDQAADGQQALAALREGEYEAVVLDHSMPEVTGASVLTWMRREGRETPVVLISGYGDDPQLNDLARDGMTRIFSKPFKPRHLVRAVRKMIDD